MYSAVFWNNVNYYWTKETQLWHVLNTHVSLWSFPPVLFFTHFSAPSWFYMVCGRFGASWEKSQRLWNLKEFAIIVEVCLRSLSGLLELLNDISMIFSSLDFHNICKFWEEMRISTLLSAKQPQSWIFPPPSLTFSAYQMQLLFFFTMPLMTVICSQHLFLIPDVASHTSDNEVTGNVSFW